MTESAEFILLRVAAGEESAVEACLDRFGGLIWSLARRYLRNSFETEDAVQEVFVELWKHAHRFDPAVSGEKTFVAMIARRRIIDRLRRQKRIPKFDSLPADETDVAAIDDPPSAEVADEAARAAAALKQLKPEQRKVLVLSIHKGWSHARIAEAMQLPLGTVKTHVRRGLIRVRQLLGADSLAAGGEVAL